MALNAILAVAATAGVVQSADSSRRAAHAQQDAINAANEAQKNAPKLTPTPVMPLADTAAQTAKRKQTIVAAQNTALLTGNNRAGTILTDSLGG